MADIVIYSGVSLGFKPARANPRGVIQSDVYVAAGAEGGVAACSAAQNYCA